MIEILQTLFPLSYMVAVIIFGWYFILLMQWYSYRFERVLFHHKKWRWHLYYFLIPLALFYLTRSEWYYWIYFYLGYLPAFVLWYRTLDKKLVITGRVKRYLGLLASGAFGVVGVCSLAQQECHAGVILPLVFAGLGSHLIEKGLFRAYYRKAQQKLLSREGLTVVAVTASYGKTSTKNYLAHILARAGHVYATPRSVNTLAGLVKDVNEDLPSDTTIYIAEAGARQKGDIAEIAHFLQPHYAIVGQVGEQHIEYFKTLDAIRQTKCELLDSKRLSQGIVHESAQCHGDKIIVYGENTQVQCQIRHVTGDLQGISFDMVMGEDVLSLKAPVLGRFNATNIASAVLVAQQLGMSHEAITQAVATLPGVPHRLQRIDAGGKIILDDSFNGNFEGMMEGVALCDTYEGRRVIITPGIVESTDEANTALGEAIDKVFDLVIITGSLNSQILCDAIQNVEKIRLRDKSKLTEILARQTKAGDLIYFANDAPNFI